MTSHILNRPAPPVEPKPAVEKQTPAGAKVVEQLRRTKLEEAVGRAISKRRF